MEEKYKFTNYKPSYVTFYSQEGTMLLRENSYIAVNPATDRILACGKEVQEKWDILKRENAAIGSPLRNGIVADYTLSLAMFKYFLKKANIRTFIPRKIAVCVPVDLTQVEHKALHDAILCIGATSVLIIDDLYENVSQSIPSAYKIIIEIIPV